MKGTNRGAILAAMSVALAGMKASFAQKMGAALSRDTDVHPSGLVAFRHRTNHNTVAQQKRAAKKRRNQLRARARR